MRQTTQQAYDLTPLYRSFVGLDRMASMIDAAAVEVHDPLWRMPFWEPYEEMI